MCVYLLPGNSEMSQQWRIHALCCTAHYAGPGRGAGRLFWQRDQILLRPTDRKTEVLSEAAATARVSEDLLSAVACAPHSSHAHTSSFLHQARERTQPWYSSGALPSTAPRRQHQRGRSGHSWAAHPALKSEHPWVSHPLLQCCPLSAWG